MSQFLWENYSTDASDRGVEIFIEWKGDIIPFRIKRSLTIDERQIANNAAIEIKLDEKTGAPVIARQDQAAYTKQVVLLGLKWWPFEFNPGKPVPITMKNISALDGGLLEKIAAHILGAVQVDKAKLDPFVPKSEEVS